MKKDKDVIDLGIAQFKIKTQPEQKVVLIGKCPFCERKIRATAQNQFDWNIALHLKQKHNEDEEAKILLNQLEKQNEKHKD